MQSTPYVKLLLARNRHDCQIIILAKIANLTLFYYVIFMNFHDGITFERIKLEGWHFLQSVHNWRKCICEVSTKTTASGSDLQFFDLLLLEIISIAIVAKGLSFCSTPNIKPFQQRSSGKQKTQDSAPVDYANEANTPSRYTRHFKTFRHTWIWTSPDRSRSGGTLPGFIHASIKMFQCLCPCLSLHES